MLRRKSQHLWLLRSGVTVRPPWLAKQSVTTAADCWGLLTFTLASVLSGKRKFSSGLKTSEKDISIIQMCLPKLKKNTSINSSVNSWKVQEAPQQASYAFSLVAVCRDMGIMTHAGNSGCTTIWRRHLLAQHTGFAVTLFCFASLITEGGSGEWRHSPCSTKPTGKDKAVALKWNEGIRQWRLSGQDYLHQTQGVLTL